jgi:hypothetical protein
MHGGDTAVQRVVRKTTIIRELFKDCSNKKQRGTGWSTISTDEDHRGRGGIMGGLDNCESVGSGLFGLSEPDPLFRLLLPEE